MTTQLGVCITPLFVVKKYLDSKGHNTSDAIKEVRQAIKALPRRKQLTHNTIGSYLR
jgi:hypothetical protein